MRRHFLSTTVASLLLLTSTAAAQGRPGVDFTAKLIALVPGVYAYEGPLHLAGQPEIVRTNSLVIVTDEGVVVADGQDNLEESRRMIEAIGKITKQPIRYLINASPHGDHVNGNDAFEGATIVAHVGARTAMQAASARAAAGASKPRLPTLTFTDSMTLHVGGKTIELYHFGLGHTRGDTVVYLPQDKVAFMSELYFNGVFASLSEGFAREHLLTLDRAMKLDVSWFVPGHGYVDKQTPEMLKAGLRRYYDNIRAVVGAVQKHVDRGDSLQKTLAEIDADLGEFARIPFYSFLKTGCITGTYNALVKK